MYIYIYIYVYIYIYICIYIYIYIIHDNRIHEETARSDLPTSMKKQLSFTFSKLFICIWTLC